MSSTSKVKDDAFLRNDRNHLLSNAASVTSSKTGILDYLSTRNNVFVRHDARLHAISSYVFKYGD